MSPCYGNEKAEAQDNRREQHDKKLNLKTEKEEKERGVKKALKALQASLTVDYLSLPISTPFSYRLRDTSHGISAYLSAGTRHAGNYCT
jgi:hypothetical protein